MSFSIAVLLAFFAVLVSALSLRPQAYGHPGSLIH